MTHEQTIQEHVDSNISTAIDQAHEYDDQQDEFCQFFEGDAYYQNTIDSCIEDGYSPDTAFEAGQTFLAIAIQKGLRFA